MAHDQHAFESSMSGSIMQQASLRDRLRALASVASSGIASVGFIAGTVALIWWIARSLGASVNRLVAVDAPLSALLMAYIVIAVGILIGVLSLLLRFVERNRWDDRKPPSLAPGIVILGMGILLAATAVMSGGGHDAPLTASHGATDGTRTGAVAAAPAAPEQPRASGQGAATYVQVAPAAR